jgi:isoleucyl-tRNA synthetase
VDEAGRYNDETGSGLIGLEVLGQGQEAVLKLVQDDIVHLETFEHSYPYDWRTKLPVILRASLQWFIDTDAIKHQALVTFVFLT